MNKCKMITLGLLMVFTGMLHCQSWTPVWTEPSHLKLSNTPPFAIGQKVFFKAIYQRYVGLWVYDDQNKQTTNLIPSIEDRFIHDMAIYNGELYFLITQPDQFVYSQLWKTDGTLAGTTLISDTDFRRRSFQDLNVHGDILYGIGDDGAILAYDGYQINTVASQVYDAKLEEMCVFGANDIIIYDYFEPRLIRVKNGSIIELTSHIPDGYNMMGLVEHGQSCLVLTRAGYNEYDTTEVLKITASGQISLLSESPDLQNINELFVHNEELLAFQTVDDEENTASLLRLDENTTTVETIWSLSGGRFTDFLSINDDQLFVTFVERPYNHIHHYYLNADFSPRLLDRTEYYFNGPHMLSSTESKALVFAENQRVNQFEIDVFKPNQAIQSLRSDGYQFKHAISSESADDLYFVLQNQFTGLVGIYTINDQPAIGQPLNGLWVSPDLNNQGLSIRQGRRNLGSEYIFTTLYTFRDGDPLWLAGVVDYQPNQSSIEIDLFEYQGTQFLELVEEPTSTAFGRIRLQMTGCDQLHLDIVHGLQETSFDMQRVENIRHQSHCLKTISP